MKINISSLQKGLVLHCPLDKEVYNFTTKRFTDKSGYSNHGTSVNSLSENKFIDDYKGKADRALDFNGTSDVVDCGNNAITKINANSTVSIWINFSGGSGLESIIANCAAGGYNGFYFAVYQGDLRMQFSDNAGYYAQAQTTNQIPSGWQHVVGTYDGNKIEFYMNEIQQSLSIDNPGSGSYPTEDTFCIGARDSGLERFFTGSIAEVRIYNRIITEDEITKIYELYRQRLII